MLKSRQNCNKYKKPQECQKNTSFYDGFSKFLVFGPNFDVLCNRHVAKSKNLGGAAAPTWPPAWDMLDEISGWISVRGCWGQQMLLFWKLLMKLKCPPLKKPLGTIIWKKCWSFYPSEPFGIPRFNMSYLYRKNISAVKQIFSFLSKYCWMSAL